MCGNSRHSIVRLSRKWSFGSFRGAALTARCTRASTQSALRRAAQGGLRRA